MCFKEFLSSQLHELENEASVDLEYDVHAFQVRSPVFIIDIDDFDLMSSQIPARERARC